MESQFELLGENAFKCLKEKYSVKKSYQMIKSKMESGIIR